MIKSRGDSRGDSRSYRCRWWRSSLSKYNRSPYICRESYNFFRISWSLYSGSSIYVPSLISKTVGAQGTFFRLNQEMNARLCQHQKRKCQLQDWLLQYFFQFLQKFSNQRCLFWKISNCIRLQWWLLQNFQCQFQKRGFQNVEMLFRTNSTILKLKNKKETLWWTTKP